ncbi:MAG: GMC family oxidoreductase [Myxococcales bacterium]
MGAERYDVIIIGTGAGGGTLARRLAPSGQRILLLERGGFLPREKQNWDTVAVFQKDRYHTSEVWYDRDGTRLHPGTGYWVGGNTKVYGAALFRLRERDFQEVRHGGGVSPAWPIAYRDLARYYDEAERLYDVHGQGGEDPTEPARDGDFPFPPVRHEPRIQELYADLVKKGLHPFHVPLGIKRDEDAPHLSTCIKCNTCDGFPCLVDAKADADLNGVRPALAYRNVTLVTGARALRLNTNATGSEVTEVVAEVNGERVCFRGSVVVVSCGAINSAVLLLRSASDRHPQGLANSSGLVGRHFMKHLNGAILGVTRRENPTVFQKTLAVNDFYWGEGESPVPMGHVQLLGKANADMLVSDAPRLAPKLGLAAIAGRSIDWWLTAEDLPDPANRVRVEGPEGERVVLDYRENNTEAYDRLLARWVGVLKSIDCADEVLPCSLYLRKKIPLQGVAHQVGTCRFGTDPKASVLDPDCRSWDVGNLYVVDGSFFASSGAVNPSLTIMANALRVGDHLLKRLGVQSP